MPLPHRSDAGERGGGGGTPWGHGLWPWLTQRSRRSRSRTGKRQGPGARGVRRDGQTGCEERCRGGGRGGSAKVEEGEGGMRRTRGEEEGSGEAQVRREGQGHG